MTHGVTEATANLAYSNDAGGLNEATSDIMGTMVEYYANNATDVPDYMIGEKIYRSNPTGKTALRYMFRPGDADGNRSYNCYPAGGLAGVDPHYSSGPANHFFYLLAEGAVNPSGFSYTPSQLVCNGDTGRGRHRPRRRAAHLVPRADGVLHLHRNLPAGACRYAEGGGRSVRRGLDAVQRRRRVRGRRSTSTDRSMPQMETARTAGRFLFRGLRESRRLQSLLAHRRRAQVGEARHGHSSGP